MYRLLILALIVSIAESRSRCHGPHCQKHDREQYVRFPEELFYKLAHHAVSVERRFEKYCRDHVTVPVKEMYTTEAYSLKFAVKDFEAKDFTVKVMHKAIYVSAERWDPTGLKTFRDVKLLPDNLNPQEASWSLQDGELEIMFPYLTPLGTDIRKTCGNINYAVVTVPMQDKP